MREELGFSKKNSMSRPHPPADIDDIAIFLSGGPGPVVDSLRLDLVTTSDGVRSHWNIEAGLQLADEFLDRVRNGNFPPNHFNEDELQRRNITRIFLSKVRYFKQLYQQLYFPLSMTNHRQLKAFLRRVSRRISVRPPMLLLLSTSDATD